MYQVDLEEFFDGRRTLDEFWIFFYDLPEGSRTKTEIAMNPEIAAERASALSEEDIAEISRSRSREGSRPEITPRGYDITVEKLNQLLDSLMVLQLTVRQIGGGKVSDGDFKPAQRPRSAYDKAVDERVRQYEKAYQEQAMADFGF